MSDLAGLGVPVVADIGSGLLRPDPLLPDEPDAATALREGAAVVTCSADKLLGGPQGGLLLGQADVVESLRRHPLARALRVDKLTLAALEATVGGPTPPTHRYLHADPDQLRRRAEKLAAETGGDVVPSAGAVGGGSAPGLDAARLGRGAARGVRAGAAARRPVRRGAGGARPVPRRPALRRGARRRRPRAPPSSPWSRRCTSSPPRVTSTTASRPSSGRSPGWSPTAGPRSAAAA